MTAKSGSEKSTRCCRAKGRRSLGLSSSRANANFAAKLATCLQATHLMHSSSAGRGQSVDIAEPDCCSLRSDPSPQCRMDEVDKYWCVIGIDFLIFIFILSTNIPAAAYSA